MEPELVFLTPLSRSGAINIRERESLASTCGQIPIVFTGYVPNGQLAANCIRVSFCDGRIVGSDALDRHS